jgi:hypothetical protein
MTEQYQIKVKDHTQSTTHQMTESAETPTKASEQALKYLRKHIGRKNNYEIKSCKPLYKKYATYSDV